MNQISAGEKGNRIAWVDILRFLGMTLIYWGHLGPSEGVTLYIFAHHVPLFFFISGFFALNHKTEEESFLTFLWKKIRSIVFPYIFFTLLFYALQLATGALSFAALPEALLISAKGIRNQVPGPLWFFTCLFLVCVLYEVLRRLVSLLAKKEKIQKTIVMACAGALFLVGIFFLGHEPAQDPSWIWNADSALVYIFYYALGALLFPVIRSFKPKALFFVFFALSVCFGCFTLIYGVRATAAVSAALQSEGLFEIYALFSALILIFMELCIARFLNLIPGIGRFLAFVGKDSLYHCGNELIIKYFGGLLLSVLGLGSLLSGDLFTLVYSILCLIILTFTLNLLERLLLGRLFRNGWKTK